MRRQIVPGGALVLLAVLAAAPGTASAAGVIKWTAAGAGSVPPEAIGAGPAPDNPIPLVCRTDHKGSWLPGELTNLGCAVATTDDGPVVATTFEVPVGAKDHEWKSSAAGQNLPSGAFVSGREGQANIYACRAQAGGGYHVGRIRRDGCMIVLAGKVDTIASYDVLCQVEAKSAQAGGQNFARRSATPPVDCTKGVASVDNLWPANHKMTMVFIKGVPDPKITSIWQDECVNGQGDGDTAPDAEIAGDRRSAMIRAERSGKEDGRVYHVRFTCAGGGEGVAKVRVPKNQNEQAGDGGAKFDSTAANSPGCDPSATPTPTPTGDCANARASIASLWPANHKMESITITGAGSYKITGVRQDECVDGQGDGDTAPDAIVSGDGQSVQIRAERGGSSDGRVYHISFTCGAGTGVVTVGVPHNNKDAAVDQGPLYDSTVLTSPGCGAATPTPAASPTPTGDCSKAAASILAMWPPNHKMETITITGVGSYRIRSVMQDECVNGQGDGDTAPDAVISGDGQSVQLRAERSGGGNGRVYRIRFDCGSGSGEVTVGVPANNKDVAVDDGPRYDSTQMVTPNCGSTVPTPTPAATATPTPAVGDCSKAVASLTELWPPNHKMENITIQGVSGARITAVLSDECVDGTGDGDTAPDAILSGDGSSAQIRSERSGSGTGRVYHVRFSTATCSGEVLVKVPHSQGGGGAAVDEGALYDARATSIAGTNCTVTPGKK